MATHDIVVIGDYISTMIFAPLSVSDFQDITDELLAACQANDIHKVIVDVMHAGGPFSESDKLAFASYASATLKDQVEKYAYIYPKDLITYAPQVISQGSGFNVRGFTSLDDALVWFDK
jgi:hypothetical protein